MQSPATAATYTDFNDIAALRATSRNNPRAALQQVAKQFEGVFVQMMLKSMRDASFGDPIFDSNQSDFYRDMFDKQVALDLAEKKGIGLAEALVQQLSRHLPANNPESTEASGNTLPPAQTAVKAEILTRRWYQPSQSESIPPHVNLVDKTRFTSQEDFVEHLLPHASVAAEELGVSPLVLVAQAALETGWGNAVIPHANGVSSYNLFNIKAGSDWSGKTVTKHSLEYVDGVAQRERSTFRAYDSYAESFKDYVDFLRSNSRYITALKHDGDAADFIHGLHDAGYATDPNYANKVLNIMQRDVLQEAITAEEDGLHAPV